MKGPIRRLSPDQQAQLIEWRKRWEAVGTIKQKARELGVPPSAVFNFFAAMKKRELRAMERAERKRGRQAFYKQLANLPF